ncbi:hypothetical protein BH11ARM2_BH11ARM2_09700 [soil metagenome]
MKTSLGIIVSGLLAAAVGGYAQTAKSSPATHTPVRLEGPHYGKVVRLRRTCGPYQIVLDLQKITSIGEDEANSWWGGPDFEFNRIPFQIVRSLQIFRNGNGIEVPRSAYADLSAVNELTVKKYRNGCNIMIQGSDASQGYDAVIRVRGGDVTERSVAAGEFPDNWNERTKYTNTTPEDP